MSYISCLCPLSRHLAVLAQFMDQNDFMFVILIFLSMSRDSDPYDCLNSLYHREQVSAPLYASGSLSSNDGFRLNYKTPQGFDRTRFYAQVHAQSEERRLT